MKNSDTRFILFAILISISLFSCKKDDDDNNTDNSFSFEDKHYKIANGFFWNYGSYDDGNLSDIDLLLTSASLAYNNTVGEFTGTGEAIYIDFNSPSLTELAAGDYSYDKDYFSDEYATRKPNTFVYGEVYIGFNVENETGTFYETDENSTGTASIKKSGNIYEISFSFKVENGKNVEGFFKGELQLLQNDKKSSLQIRQKDTGI